jgi:hypothetical protein
MSELAAFVIAVCCRFAVVGLAIAAAVYLADQGKDGWGWFIFVAVFIGSGSINYKKDENEKRGSTD